MEIKDIVEQTIEEFGSSYTQFRDFQENPEYQRYWDKCIECISDRDILFSIIFCNDTFGIPPVKTFLTYYCEDFIKITGDQKAQLDAFLKRSIGAFWGMVFKFILGYTKQKRVSVSKNDYFLLKSASVYSERPKDLIITGDRHGTA